MQASEHLLPKAEVSLSAISEAVDYFKSDSATWIVATLITFVINSVISGISQGALFSSATTISSGGATPTVNPFSFIFPFISIVYLISLVVNCLLWAGLFRMATKQMRGQSISISDLFNFGDIAVQAILGGIIVALLIGVGSIFCLIPGLILTGLLMFTFPLIVDQKLSASAAISLSINTIKSQWLMGTLFIIVAGFIYTIGILFCFIGVLFTAPVAILSIAVLYRNFFIKSDSRPLSGQAFDPAIPPGS